FSALRGTVDEIFLSFRLHYFFYFDKKMARQVSLTERRLCLEFGTILLSQFSDIDTKEPRKGR
ncbi:MAG: hypothetical protein KAR00_03100, partial [Candidatus Pacebacteria bacterium]|nr:hypothetical protein [Candidatus Paceibacterota bacterium]